MISRLVFLVLIVWGLSLTRFSLGQLQGTNLMEYQFGAIPADTFYQSSLYDRAIINYRYNHIKGGITLEQFNSAYSSREYLALTQYNLQFDASPISIKLGNYHETIGRGLLLRSFEVPGAILEDLSYRSRHYFHRDIQGFSASYKTRQLMIKFLQGKPLQHVFPPTVAKETRRPTIMEALHARYDAKGYSFEGAALRSTQNANSEWHGMFSTSGVISPTLSFYLELAKGFSGENFLTSSPLAIYGNVNLSLGNLGLSIEYKNYQDFLIGSGINEPPALVKEHSYKVLNRSTHVLQPTNEQGYQLEAIYSFQNRSILTANHTLAVNDFGKRFVFEEYFIEYEFVLPGDHDMKIFTDYARDELKLETDRLSTGAYILWKIPGGIGIKTEYEYQQFSRLGQIARNQVMTLGTSYRSKLSVAITGELSTDPFLSSKGTKYWIGGNARYQVHRDHTLQVFVGQRRGGPACTAGICYEVLDFEGAEIRLTSRF